jgi:hypothetical protein
VRRVLDGHDSEKLVIGCIPVLCGLAEFNLDINKGMCIGIKYLTWMMSYPSIPVMTPT